MRAKVGVIVGVILKMKEIRMVYPHLGEPDKWGKYSVGALIRKDSQAYKDLVEGLKQAWAEGADKYGKQQFETNPTEVRLLKAAYVRSGGDVDNKGRPLPEWLDGYVMFGITSNDVAPVVDANLEPVIASSPSVCYSGQNCHISLDLVPFMHSETRNSGISRYLRSVVVLGGGEQLAVGGNRFTDIVEEWS